MSSSCPGPETLPGVGAIASDDRRIPLQLARATPAGDGVFTNPVLDSGPGRDHGDPFVLRWRGGYFLYCTGLHGIEVWTSDDLVHWTRAGLALAAPAGDHWAQIDLWAPEVLYADGSFFMYVTGTRQLQPGVGRNQGVGVDTGDDRLRRQGIARARHPLGPFALDPAPLLDVWSIDGHPFVDVDGRRWLFYNVRDDRTRFGGTTPGCGNVVDELVAPDAVRGEPTPVALPDAGWEGNRAGTWYWNEGPTVLRHRNRYVQMYSGGWYGDDSYGVGFAVAPDPRGPWQKAAHNPVFVSGTRITGPGHHSVTVGPDGVTPYAVYHGYVDGKPGRKVHVDRLHWSTEGPRIGDGALPACPSEGEQPVPDPAVHDPEVPFWHAELWARGRAVRLGRITVDLPADRDVLLDVTMRREEARILLDGRLVAEGRSARAASDLADDLRQGYAVDGRVLSLALTSWLSEPQERAIPPGETVVIPWGGSRPVEVVLAVTGSALVHLTDAGTTVAEAAVEPSAFPVLVRLRTTKRVDLLEVIAAGDAVLISDVLLTGR